MSRLLLIRHAQATFSADPSEAFHDYDRLSPLGERQAEALGVDLSGAGVVFDRVFVGPARRHRETADGVARVYERLGLPWPDEERVDGLAEHDGSTLVRRVLEAPGHEETLAALAAGGDDDEEARRKRAYFTAFQRVMRQWARGELPAELVTESWQAFRSRVADGVRHVLESAGSGVTVAVFTSGGPIGSTVADALGLGDDKALELSWMVDNTTISEILFSRGRTSLKSFNVQPHLRTPELITDV